MIRAAAGGDLSAVHALFERWAAAVDEPALALETLRTEWARPGFDVERDHWVAERDGELVGYATLRAGGDVTARGEVEELLPLVEARARERGDTRLELIVTTRAGALLEALAAAGWTPLRDVHRMQLDLEPEPPEPRFPVDVSVRAYEHEDARRLHAFVELAFAENNERIEPFEEWLHFMTAHGDFDPAWWHLAEEAAGGLVGCVLTWAPFDGKGWVKDLAVHPERRREGLGEALLHHAARAYRAAGVRQVGLKVDADNPTGAPRLYERLGYVTDRVYAILERRLP